MVEKLYTVYYRELLKYCIALSHNKAQAEDIVQDTFLRAMANIDTLENLSDAQCRAWLYKTARNLYIDRFRKASRETEELVEEGCAEDDLSEVMVSEVMSVLSPQDKALFWMRYMEGYNATELGEIFNIPSGTVRARLSKACRIMEKYYLVK